MKKIEMIVNRAVEEDILEELSLLELDGHYTLTSPVHGTGRSGPRKGSSVWPEENSHILLIIPDEQLTFVRSAFLAVKDRFPGMGMKCYISTGIEELR
jgi:nitrogen regulatory protein PII